MSTQRESVNPDRLTELRTICDEIRELEGGDLFAWEWLGQLELPAQREGETDSEWTDRINASGRSLGRYRQCSIGWHEECSDPSGDECLCPCHSSRMPNVSKTAATILWMARKLNEVGAALPALLDIAQAAQTWLPFLDVIADNLNLIEGWETPNDVELTEKVIETCRNLASQMRGALAVFVTGPEGDTP